MSEDCTADIEHYLSRTGQFIMNAVVPIIAGTIFWTLYLVSVVLTAGVLWRKGFDRARTALLGLLLMMFILETLTFALSLFTFFQQTREILLMGIFEGDSLIRVQYPIETINAINQPIFLLMVSLALTGDCIVIWRAYAVWTRSKLIMIIPVIFLLGFIVDFPFFVHCNFRHRRDIVHGSEATYCFATNTSALILSFSANISATLTIFYMAWTYYASQRILRVQSGALPSQTSSKVARILLLLVESGFVYFLIMTFSIAISSWRVPAYAPSTVIVYTLGAITSHCIGMVPTLTVFLVSVYGSFEDHHSTIDASQPIRFTSPRVTQSSYASAIRSLPSREPDVAETYDVVGPSGLSKESSETKL
ncbi:hypothetical protein C8J56DRAFT_917094 [Mycena floridula]|nr:hypothetical protein C8J56DRAFT_917094 [Mycena floridula]